jgi:hypothetical protein
LFNELTYSCTALQAKIHLELLGAFVDDGALDRAFLNL